MKKMYNSRPITTNITKNELVKSLNYHGISCKFGISENEIADFIDDLLTNKKINKSTIDKIYYELIYFRQHKCCYLSEFEEFGDESFQYGKAMLEKNYGIKKPFVDFMVALSRGEKIVALEYCYAEKILDAIKLVFRKEIKTTIEDEIKVRYAFIPIIIQIPQKRVIVMVNPKRDGAKEKEHVFSHIAKDYLDKIKCIFKLKWVEIRNKYAQYNHCITLNFTNEICRLAMGNPSELAKEKLAETIELSSKAIENFLETHMKITCMSEKRLQSSLLNIHENIQSVIENAVISNYIVENGKGISANSKIGYISYIKFHDRTNSLMRMRGEYLKPITDSETFLSLRNDLKKYREISAIRIKWLQEDMKFDVKYELENMTTLVLRFYHEFCEGDYNNAIQEYEKFGQDAVAEVCTVDKVET
ncbi:MAG: hypothetical protein FWC89_05505 [Defluviitaleaceae bacterium]|nr:hypothetical protein [Defluviitaleaceae bacterium]